MLDPAIHLLVACGFAVLFTTAAWHKLTRHAEFVGILGEYQLLPAFAVPVVALLLPMAELGLGLAWASGLHWPPVALASAALLLLYAMAMVINLSRGRSYIDCGCGFSASGTGGGTSAQPIAAALVARNLLLAAVACLDLLPVVQRQLGALDYVGTVFAAITLFFLYAAFNQLTVNRNAIDSWRSGIGGEPDA